jgi:molybdate transport repressor ModE-like protein
VDADDLSLLDAVITEGSITVAARKLDLPKTTVSRRLKRLESAAGAPLFDRAGRRLRLTELGRKLAVPAAQLRASLAEARSLAAASRDGQSELRVASPFLFGRIVLSSYFARFLAANQAVTGILKFDNAWIDPLRSEFDLAIRIERPVEAYLTVARLATARLQLYAAPSIAARIRSLADLGRFPAVQTANLHASTVSWRLTDAMHQHEVQMKVRSTVNDPESACELVTQGVGVGSLPSFLARALVVEGRVQPVLPQFNAGQVVVQAVLPPGRSGIPIVRQFLDGLKAELAATRFAE